MALRPKALGFVAWVTTNALIIGGPIAHGSDLAGVSLMAPNWTAYPSWLRFGVSRTDPDPTSATSTPHAPAAYTSAARGTAARRRHGATAKSLRCCSAGVSKHSQHWWPHRSWLVFELSIAHGSELD